MEYAADDALAAIDNNPGGEDIRVLIDWIHKNRWAQPDTPSTSQKVNPRVRQVRICAKGSRETPWTKVAQKPRSIAAGPTVVGSETAQPTWSSKSARTLSQNGQSGKQRAPEEKVSTSGEFGLSGGSFTWFFDGKGSPAQARGLSQTQAKELRQFLEALLASDSA
jgi:hypothetical protein